MLILILAYRLQEPIRNLPPISQIAFSQPKTNVFRDVRPVWENINKRQPAMLMTKEALINLPCIKTSINITLTDPSSKVKMSANDFDLMKDTNTSTALCKQLWGNGSICPELLPVMWDNYRESKCNCTTIWVTKVNFTYANFSHSL